MKYRIDFKTLSLIHKCTYDDNSPIYLKNLLTKSVGNLRSNDSIKYIAPFVSKEKLCISLVQCKWTSPVE